MVKKETNYLMNEETLNNEKIVNKILRTFSKKDDSYYKKIRLNDTDYEFYYFPNSNNLILDLIIEGKIIKEWIYDFKYNSLYLKNLKDNYELKCNSVDNCYCIFGICKKNEYNQFIEILELL